MSSVAHMSARKTRTPHAGEPILLARPVKVPAAIMSVQTLAQLFDAVIKREFRQGGAFAPQPGTRRMECREQGSIEDKARCVYDLLPCRDVSPSGQAMIKHFIDHRSLNPVPALRSLLEYSTYRDLRIAMHMTPAGHVALRWQRA